MRMQISTSTLAVLAVAAMGQCSAFTPQPFTSTRIGSSSVVSSTPFNTPSTSTSLNMMEIVDSLTNAQTLFDSSASSLSSLPSVLTSFTDQGQNLAGIFFQSSLLPYLAFLYFLSFRGNRTPNLGNFGWQYLLFFVLSTIPSGILTKSIYSETLANVDWLHGSAEFLLTVTNVLIVLGFRNAMTVPKEPKVDENGEIVTPFLDTWKPKAIALGCFGAFGAALAAGPGLGFEAHSAFLFGLGNLPADVTSSLPWVVHTEPANALSIPTWAIHSSSVIEFLFAMDIIWNYSKSTGNETWKGLAWGMLPLHASGIAACTYHFFYNPSSFQFLVTTQAGLTLLGNITVAIAAYRIAVSNGWTLRELNPLPSSSTSPMGIVVDNTATAPLLQVEAKESDGALFAKLGGLTLLSAYIIKYGELGLDVPFEASAPVAIAMVAGIPALTAFNFYKKSEGSEGFQIPSFGGFGSGDGEGPSLSMADVKKYGVAGTVAYVLTELAFWAVAFPVASTALYQSTGHWPDVINDTADRTTVLGFIFAGANIARLLVPLRLGAALALAPWVDENILNREEVVE